MKRPRRHKRSTCETTGKRMFRSEIAAQRALAGTVGEVGSIRTYWCEFCYGWHTTSKPFTFPENKEGDT